MRHVECARCGYEIMALGKRDDHGKYIHAGFCPIPPARETEPVPATPFIIRSSVRPFCRKSEHNQCSGATIEGERIASVCLCGCHSENSAEQRA